MKYFVPGLITAALVVGAGAVWAHEGMAETQESAPGNTGADQTLTGEVVDVFCYLSHGKDGLGKGHAGCAQHCIKNGLPVAIKVGDRLYLATMTDHTPANAKLADFAGEQVTVHGKVMEQDGQQLIAITDVAKAQ